MDTRQIAPVTLGVTDKTIIDHTSVVDYMAFAVLPGAVDVEVTVTDGNGMVFLPGTSMQEGHLTTLQLAEGGLRFDGLKMRASVAGVVNVWIRYEG
jgi:hypothetical protein